MLYPSRAFIVIITLILGRISQAEANGCSIGITLPLAIKDKPQNYTATLSIGTILKFYCLAQDHITYVLVGAPKIKCQKDSTWSSKKPKCKATLCSPSPHSVPNAQLLTKISAGQNNKVGDTVEYQCLKGYAGQSKVFTKVCQKNGYWQGNVACKKVTCSTPVDLQNGHVTYTSLDHGSTARYVCNKGYSLNGPYTRICDDDGWSGSVPFCNKMCHALINPKNGYFTPASSMYKTDSVVHLRCLSNRFAVRGSPTRKCLKSGQWDGIPSKCVINSCGTPGPFKNGRLEHDKDLDRYNNYLIGTTLKFDCFSGYKLDGPETRQCLDTGIWSKEKNPSCIEVFCSEPGHMLHGDHNHKRQGKYPLGTKLVYTCDPHFYMWSKTDTLECTARQLFPFWSSSTPLCLTLTQFNTRCHEINGHFHIANGHPYCVQQATPTPSSNSNASNHNMDTLTIVTASAGSTLGVLVIILSIMVFVRRFHRNRRLRQHNIRSRFYSDDDHVTLIACPSGFHFSLPSYDEAMSQAQRDPPPFESVVLVNGTTINNNSNTTPSDAVSAEPDAHDRTVLEVSTDQQINIVSNPLTESQRNEPESNSDTVLRERNSISSQESLVISEPTSQDGTVLSLSDDEQSVNESAPLIGSN